MSLTEKQVEELLNKNSTEEGFGVGFDEDARKAWASIVNPHRFVMVPDYIIKSWIPLLGGSRTLLVLAFRQLAFISRCKEIIGEEITRATFSQLSRWSGLSVGAVHKLLSDPGYLTWFVRGIGESKGADGRPLTNRDRRTYHVRIDIPLTPHDQLRLYTYLRDHAPVDDNDWPRALYDASGAKKVKLDDGAQIPETPKTVQEIVEGLRSPDKPLPAEIDQACVELYEQWVTPGFFGRATHYFLHEWVSELSPSLACLILWSRRRAYLESEDDQYKHLRIKNNKGLADAIGVSKKTIQRYRKNSLASLFLSFIDEYEFYGRIETINPKRITLDGRNLYFSNRVEIEFPIEVGDIVRAEVHSRNGEALVIKKIAKANDFKEHQGIHRTGIRVEVRLSDPVHPKDWSRYTRLLQSFGKENIDFQECDQFSDKTHKVEEISGKSKVNIQGTKLNNSIGEETIGAKVNNVLTEVNNIEPLVNDHETNLKEALPEVNEVGTDVNALKELKDSIKESQYVNQQQLQEGIIGQEPYQGEESLQHDVVVAGHKIWNIYEILKQGAIRSQERKKILAEWHERWDGFVAHLLFGISQKSIEHPVLFAARRFLDHEEPPREYLELARTHPVLLLQGISRYDEEGRWEVREALRQLMDQKAERTLMMLGALDPELVDEYYSAMETIDGIFDGVSTADMEMEFDEPAITDPGIESPAISIWRSAIGQLQMELPRATFDTWVRDIELVGVDGDTLVLGVANEYARDWLDDRIKSTAERVLRGITGRSAKVRFVVMQEVG